MNFTYCTVFRAINKILYNVMPLKSKNILFFPLRENDYKYLSFFSTKMSIYLMGDAMPSLFLYPPAAKYLFTLVEHSQLPRGDIAQGSAEVHVRAALR